MAKECHQICLTYTAVDLAGSGLYTARSADCKAEQVGCSCTEAELGGSGNPTLPSTPPWAPPGRPALHQKSVAIDPTPSPQGAPRLSLAMCRVFNVLTETLQ